MDVLEAQLAELDATYQEALARHAARDPAPARATPNAGPRVFPERVSHSLDGVFHGFSRVVLDRDPSPRLNADPRRYLREHGLSSGDAAAVARMGAPRLEVYRALPRSGIEGTVEDFLTRTRARMGADDFAEWVARWFDEEGPRSRYLRDLPAEFASWAAPRWLRDPAIPNYLADLARHELIEYEVAAAPPGSSDDSSDSFALDRGLTFDASARLLRYDHAVHELSGDEDDREPAPARPTSLLIYRDRENHVRYVELTTVAAAVVDKLMAGAVVQSALVGGAQAAGEALDDALLGRMSLVLADLAERQLVTVQRST